MDELKMFLTGIQTLFKLCFHFSGFLGKCDMDKFQRTILTILLFRVVWIF